LAGDTTPIDVISHYPGYCNEMNIPFVFVNNRNNLGESCSSKRGIAVVFVQKPSGKEDYAEDYEKMAKLIKKQSE
jgi:H/ACA ribonucleoprotein complex subunit 2